ncbi:MAG TPA: hypothetical protein VFJ82_18305 [Longimicrobium sp.]|nr:hypothetical protein [Longimicrobium sp.]
MRTDRRLFSAALLLCAATLAACDGSPSDPGELPEGKLAFIRAAANAPPLETAQIQVWAKAGDGRRAEIKYAKVGEYGGDKCLEFDIPGDALLTRPDGTPFAKGDSVLITIRVVDPAAFKFEFSPSGLRFNADHPAELRISYKWADPDLNGDGRVDDRDRSFSFEIWKQENDGGEWFKVGTSRDRDLQELRADITGFTKYAMAGGV